MKPSDLAGLREGDLVRHVGTGQAFVVVRGWDGQRAVATRTLDVTNPMEWDRVVEPDRVGMVREPAPRLRRSPAERYQTDPAFHSLVATLESLLCAGDYTPSELREAVLLAAQIHEARTVRPRFWSGGGIFEG